MVDFKKRLSKKAVEKPLGPEEIYDRLDRASDKGPLRPAQSAVLEEWHQQRRDLRDVIVKLHTGQGKTLVGLLILQSKLNENQTPALYLCPNRFLARQTVQQAAQFGVRCVTADAHIPASFLDGDAILVTHVQKVFNGLTTFGLGNNSINVGTILIDDAHACVDSIRQSCVISLRRDDSAYKALVQLFAPDLEKQGAGTFAEIKQGSWGALLPIPYWAWRESAPEVASILSQSASSKAVKFAWPLIKDMLEDCLCVITGEGLEIAPYLPPLHMFGSYAKAQHRVFMSATVTDDAFLIKGLGLSAEVITQPITYAAEKWAGEKMVLIPSLIDPRLDDASIVERFAKPVKARKRGVVVLCPSFDACKKWEASGAVVADTDTIDDRIEQMRDGNRDDVLVTANRYDGIDLPDDVCRILVVDGKPFAEGLHERYIEGCREGSAVVATRTARSIEQGLGRSVRGEKDYCVILLMGPNLIRAIRSRDSRQFLSPQTRSQVEIGLEIAELAHEEISEGTPPVKALFNLIQQCLKRDPSWKEFYVERMNTAKAGGPPARALQLLAAELEAEQKYAATAYGDAADTIQKLIDGAVHTSSDKGWYLQEKARLTYPMSKETANKLQIAAHQANRYLLRPQTGMVFTRIVVSQKRVQKIIDWIGSFGSCEELLVTVDDMLGNLKFGVRADDFERALNDLGTALGFESQRPDKEWKEGPDNLWALRKGDFLLLECKSEVQLTRKCISKGETGQMNNASAWFEQRYPGAKAKRIMVIPTRVLGPGAGFSQQVHVMNEKQLKRLTRAVHAFFSEFSSLDPNDLPEAKVQAFIDAHGLSIDALLGEYSEKVKA